MLVAVSAHSTGRTHRLAKPVASLSKLRRGSAGFPLARTACGRRIAIDAAFGADGWSRALADYRRIGATHETYVCAYCARLED